MNDELIRRAQRQVAADTLEAQGAEIAKRIDAKLLEILGEDLPALDAIHDVLVKEFHDVVGSGLAASTRLIRLFLLANCMLAAEKRLRQERQFMRRSDIQIRIYNLRQQR